MRTSPNTSPRENRTPNSLSEFGVPVQWSDGDSNPGPPACKAGALPAKLSPRKNNKCNNALLLV
jgi:hypothetical protein